MDTIKPHTHLPKTGSNNYVPVRILTHFLPKNHIFTNYKLPDSPNLVARLQKHLNYLMKYFADHLKRYIFVPLIKKKNNNVFIISG
jgi:hypothetical protein